MYWLCHLLAQNWSHGSLICFFSLGGKNVMLLNSWQHHSVFFEVFHLFGCHLNWMSYTCTTLILHIQMCPLVVWLRSICFDLGRIFHYKHRRLLSRRVRAGAAEEGITRVNINRQKKKKGSQPKERARETESVNTRRRHVQQIRSLCSLVVPLSCPTV